MVLYQALHIPGLDQGIGPDLDPCPDPDPSLPRLMCRTVTSLNLSFNAREVVDKHPDAVLDEIEATVLEISKTILEVRQDIDISAGSNITPLP